ncbi:hypothetical protein Emtol_0014 (plasmid) [Emticicia oligotrophica DSM 17448]|uniref:Histidine kinase n=1 Tax=Emticicia oligotrophica (strain DSM 17448 / CIP 109782 / MTCC 6937 / GPTSA100-15) TaxID=929562 RepID=A0ABN4AWL0_EMTOG|nr:hypothetical protein [Emticicia oligotrophica]AFK05748.1 hypothetical protein Emtol_0014 [Emticicia oligotrophica DSM 17448]
MTFNPHLPDYETFRRIADGMNILMSIYSFLSYFKNKNLAFLLYSITLLSGLIEYYIIDQFHLAGKSEIITSSFAPEMTCFNVFLYCIFIIKTFDGHSQDKLLFKRIYFIILILIFTILINLILKTNKLENLSLWVYGITILICTILLGVVYKMLYKLTFSFMKYYFIGSIFIVFGWILKSLFQTYPVVFSSIITFERNNPFTFPNTYGQLGAIFESIFIFIAISESHKLLELSKIDLKKKIILSIEERNKDDKIIIEIKQKILVTVITTFSHNLKQLLSSVEQILQALSIGDNLKATPLLGSVNNLSSESIQIIRSIVREFSEQNELILNKSIESKALEISKYHLSQKQITFSLYVNEAEFWQKIDNDFEEHILLFYENILKVFIKYKDFLHIIITLSIGNNNDLFLIIQDDGQKLKAKKRMIDELNLIKPELRRWRGEIYYSIEDNEESTVRVHFTATANN